MFAGATRHTSGECLSQAEGDVGEHPEGLHWACSREQHVNGVQMKSNQTRPAQNSLYYHLLDRIRSV